MLPLLESYGTFWVHKGFQKLNREEVNALEAPNGLISVSFQEYSSFFLLFYNFQTAFSAYVGVYVHSKRIALNVFFPFL